MLIVLLKFFECGVNGNLWKAPVCSANKYRNYRFRPCRLLSHAYLRCDVNHLRLLGDSDISYVKDLLP
jgi:hypothetical protein